jgi:hypothetical protein
MAAISADLRKLLVRTKITVLPEDYLAIRLPLDSKAVPGEWYRPATTSFAVFIREPREISLIVTRRKWLRMQSIFRRFKVSEPMKVICFNRKLSMVVPGYMCTIGAILAKENISVLPVSSISSDHILVRRADLPPAVRLLRQLIQSCREPASD